MGIKAAVKQRLGRDDLTGLRFAVQGVGNVGYRLAEHLHESGARLWVTDLHDDQTLKQLHATVVAGAANNQLTQERHGGELMKLGILYVPDYVINAGGIIDISLEHIGFDRDKLVRHLEGIYDTLMETFERAGREQRPTGVIADHIAEERFRKQ